MTRAEFEAFLSSPPYERDVSRFPPRQRPFLWTGQYVDIAVQLAWEVLQEEERRRKQDDKE